MRSACSPAARPAPNVMHRAEHGIDVHADRDVRGSRRTRSLRTITAARRRAARHRPSSAAHARVSIRPSRRRSSTGGTGAVRQLLGGVGRERHRIAEAPRRRERFVQRVRRQRGRDRQTEGREQRVRLHLGQHRGDWRTPRRCECVRCRADPAGAARAAAAAPRAAIPDCGDTRPGTRMPRPRSPACRNSRRRPPRAPRRPRGDRSIPSHAAQNGLGRAARDGRDRARRIGGAAVTGRGTCSASTASTCGSESAASTAAASRLGVASPRTLSGLRHATFGGMTSGERLLGRRREFGEHDAAIRGAVGGERARAVPVGDDGEPIAARDPVHRENARGGEQLRIRLHADGAGTLHRGVEHGIGRRPVGGAALRRASGLEHDDGLGPRRRAQRRQESSRVADRLRVEQDAVGFRVVGAMRPAARRSRRRCRRRARRPSRSRFPPTRRNRASPCTRPPTARRARAAPARRRRAERRVEADVGADHAERMRTEHANAARRRRGEQFTLPAPRFVGIDRRRRDSTTAALTPDARAVVENRGHRRARHRDQRQLDRLPDRAQRRVGAPREHAAMVRIDGEERAVEIAAEQVLHDDPARGARLARCADERDRCRHQQRTKVVREFHLRAGLRSKDAAGVDAAYEV